jgi:hypothetical protein
MFAALISGKTAKQTEVLSGVKQQPTKVMGTSRGERLAPLRTDDVANRAQNLAIRFVRKGSRSRRNHNPRWHGSKELLNAKEIERGGHDGDQ